MTIKFVGIDPGSKGAVAVINENGSVDTVQDLANDTNLHAFILEMLWLDRLTNNDTFVTTVEDVCGRPGQSCKANTTFMKLAGYAEMMGCMLGYIYNTVKPQVWKKHFGLITPSSMTKTEKKHLSIAKAKELFPDFAEHLTASKDGRAEALLIALYGKHLYEERNNQR